MLTKNQIKYKNIFINRAKEKYGDRYDYSNIEFVNSRTYISIKCPKHGNFQAMPKNHLISVECNECKKDDKTRERISNFLAKSQIMHPDRYEYINLELKNSLHEYVNIKCLICLKIFKQEANHHIHGSGCPNGCYGTRKNKLKTTDELIKEMNSLNNICDYDFSLIKYITAKDKVEIICRHHGPFWMIPNNFILGQRCPKCRNEKTAELLRKSSDEFINQAKITHMSGCDYSKVNYINNRTPITIICLSHGEYEQLPNTHLKSIFCCPKGAIEYITKIKTKPLSQFIFDAQAIHGKEYDYSKVNYVKNDEYVTIICKISDHGDFQKTPQQHIGMESGCPKCTPRGYSKKAIKWLDYMACIDLVKIQHAENGGEIKISDYRVDGFDSVNNTIYEFYGDFWHGNPHVYNSDYINPFNGKTMGELHQNTIKREEKLKNMGYKVIIIWESEWNEFLKENPIFN